MKMNPYLFFNGDCEAAFKFYAECLGGKIDSILTHAGTPAEQQVPPEWHDKVLHARLVVGDQVLMASDAPPTHYQKPQGFCVSVAIDEPSDAERIFARLSEKGSIQMPMAQTFWARRFGMCVDQFGVPWMVNCE